MRYKRQNFKSGYRRGYRRRLKDSGAGDVCFAEAVKSRCRLTLFCDCFSENTTELRGEPIESVSVWFWNNTDLVSLYSCDISLCVFPLTHVLIVFTDYFQILLNYLSLFLFFIVFGP